MWKKILIILLTLIVYCLLCFLIHQEYKKETINYKSLLPKAQKQEETLKVKHIAKEEHPIGYLTIKKLNLYEELYDINSPKNNIEEHVTILKQSEEPAIQNSTFFIAAHSGTGPLAYFKDLNQLVINDIVILEYKNHKYTYRVKNIWTDKKIGTITVPKENINQLILTTCHPTKPNYQLTINCIST